MAAQQVRATGRGVRTGRLSVSAGHVIASDPRARGSLPPAPARGAREPGKGATDRLAGPARIDDDRYLPHPDAGINEVNVSRAAIWWLAPDRQMPVWKALELTGFEAIVSGIPPHLGPLTVRDACVFVALQTMWARQSAAEREMNRVVYSLHGLHLETGRTDHPSGEDLESLRRSLERLTYATIERHWWDGRRGEEVHQVRRLIADADFIKRGRPGQYGRAQRGFISFAPEIFRQLQDHMVSYALDKPTLFDLPTGLAQRLYLLLAGDAMRPMASDQHVVTFSYRLGQALYDTLGIQDRNASRIRQRITQAGIEIMNREPLYQRIAVEPLARGGGWKLVVVRLKGRSRAPKVRQKREDAARLAALRPSTSAPRVSLVQEATTLSPLIDQESLSSLSPLIAERRAVAADTRAAERRRALARQDPRARAAFERWLIESTRNPRSEIGWREYYHDIIAWLEEGASTPEPAPPVFDEDSSIPCSVDTPG